MSSKPFELLSLLLKHGDLDLGESEGSWFWDVLKKNNLETRYPACVELYFGHRTCLKGFFFTFCHFFVPWFFTNVLKHSINNHTPHQWCVLTVDWKLLRLVSYVSTLNEGPLIGQIGKIADWNDLLWLMVQKFCNHQLRLVVYLIIYKVLVYITGGWPWDFPFPKLQGITTAIISWEGGSNTSFFKASHIIS